MSQRIWFTAQNTHGLTEADLAVLNRAVRNAYAPNAQPSRVELTVFRTVYRPGMSADEVLAAANSPN